MQLFLTAKTVKEAVDNVTEELEYLQKKLVCHTAKKKNW